MCYLEDIKEIIQCYDNYRNVNTLRINQEMIINTDGMRRNIVFEFKTYSYKEDFFVDIYMNEMLIDAFYVGERFANLFNFISTFQIPSRQDGKKVYYRDVFDEYLQNHFANTVNKLYCLLYAMRGI